MASALEVVPPGEPWQACPLQPEAAAAQSARVAPRPCALASSHKRSAQHAAWRCPAAQDMLAQLRGHCARCEVTAQVRRTHGMRTCVPRLPSGLPAVAHGDDCQ